MSKDNSACQCYSYFVSTQIDIAHMPRAQFCFISNLLFSMAYDMHAGSYNHLRQIKTLSAKRLGNYC